jgi:NAD+ diphosphatase
VTSIEARMPPLARSGLHRMAHRRTDAEWLAQAWQRAKVLLVDSGDGAGGVRHSVHALLRDDHLLLLDPAEAPEGERLFLGEDEHGTPYFAVMAELPEIPDARQVTVRDVGHVLSDLEGGLLTTAIALANWHARHRYSPVDGAPTAVAEAGWARTGDGGLMIWPRTDPAVIVLVHDGVPGDEGRCLLGHNAAWTRPGWTRRYSCLAGFVEAGESAEATVVREVAEEVGVRVSRLHYLGSQAWPYPGSLMLGFTALADPDQPVHVDETEISAARWFTRTEIRAAVGGERDDFGLPMASSIALFLIMEWLAGRP